jgi:hypothetical protein
MNGYSRTFFRVDSGALPTAGSRLSLSYSYTDAEKWKGPGDLGPRNNLNFMVEQPITGKDSIQVWLNFNNIEHSQDVCEAGAQENREQDDERKPRNRHEHVHEPHEKDPKPFGMIARRAAHQEARRRRPQTDCHGDEKRDAASGQHLAQNILAKPVGPQKMVEARR